MIRICARGAGPPQFPPTATPLLKYSYQKIVIINNRLYVKYTRQIACDMSLTNILEFLTYIHVRTSNTDISQTGCIQNKHDKSRVTWVLTMSNEFLAYIEATSQYNFHLLFFGMNILIMVLRLGEIGGGPAPRAQILINLL